MPHERRRSSCRGLVGVIEEARWPKVMAALSPMNTAQLIVLWYAGLVTAAILVFQTFGRESASFLIAAIALLAALLIYTLKPHPSARKRWVLLAVGGPLLLGPLAFYGWWSYEERISAREQIREALLIPSERV